MSVRRLDELALNAIIKTRFKRADLMDLLATLPVALMNQYKEYLDQVAYFIQIIKFNEELDIFGPGLEDMINGWNPTYIDCARNPTRALIYSSDIARVMRVKLEARGFVLRIHEKRGEGPYCYASTCYGCLADSGMSKEDKFFSLDDTENPNSTMFFIN